MSELHGDLVARLVQQLQQAEIEYMVCGSLASTFYGEYRATNDVDIVIAPAEEQLIVLLESLGGDFYVNPTAAREALKHKSMFNVIHPRSGFKADLIIRKDRPFSIEEFRRRQLIEFAGARFYVVSAEDSILSKLEWARTGQSERQFRDALGVAVVQGENLDVEYLRKWATELQVQDLLDKLLQRTQHESH